LANDALESAAPDRIVERYRNRDCGLLCSQLHDSTTAALAHSNRSVLLQNLADLGSGEGPKFTQRAPQLE
jgi:hypothetical protein